MKYLFYLCVFCFAPNNNAHHLTPTFYVSCLAGYPAGYSVSGQPDIRPDIRQVKPDTKKGRISGATLQITEVSTSIYIGCYLL